MRQTISFHLNGRATRVTGAPDRALLTVLRDDLGLTGTKYGCGIGACGACTVLVERRPVRACRTEIASVAGREVLTIEGLARGDRLAPVQQAFIDHGAVQCGYCTPGMVLAAHALLEADPHPSRESIALALEHHLCRCGTHQRVLDAVEAAARSAGGGP